MNPGMRLVAAGCFGVFSMAALIADGARPALRAPVFGPRPRFLFTREELDAWRADPAKSNELAQIAVRAEALLSARRAIPDREGQWIFYYACPADGARLRPESPLVHRCPVCGKMYTDERTVAAWRTLVFNELDSEVRDMGIAYGLTGDERFAARAREILLRLAALYPSFERHDRWGRTGLLAVVGGRRYSQLLDEACGVIQLAAGYDLAAPAACFSDGDRRLIEEKLLRLIARETGLFQHFIDERCNHQTWFNAACAAVGLVIGDEELMREAICGSRGLMFQLASSVTDDGLWYEGAIAYHFYALSAVQTTLDAARRAGWDFSSNGRLKSLWEGPSKISYPDGSLPVFHDSDRASLANYRSFFEWAGRYFKDPVLAAMGRGDFPSDDMKASAVLADIGIAVLRRNSGRDAVCVMMDWGKHGGAHGHPDKLNTVLYALGRELALDPGRISYSVPEYRTWCRTTAAHNTVAVNGSDQDESDGALLHFEETGDYVSCLAAADRAYPGLRLSRWLLLTDGWLLDVFAVEGRKSSQIDLLFHCRGDVAGADDFVPLEKPLRGSGYEHFQNVRTAPGRKEAAFEFRQPDGRSLRVTTAGDETGVFLLGEGIGYTLNDSVPCLMRRRKAASTVFVTLYDFGTDGGPKLLDIVHCEESGKALPPWQAIGVRVSGERGSCVAGVDFRQNPSGRAKVAGREIRRMAFCFEEPRR